MFGLINLRILALTSGLTAAISLAGDYRWRSAVLPFAAAAVFLLQGIRATPGLARRTGAN